MSYTPTNWKTGDVVTSEKLNKLENGIADASPLVVLITMTIVSETVTLTTDKTAGEIFAALPYAIFMLEIPDESGGTMFHISDWSIGDGLWVLNLNSNVSDSVNFTTSSADSLMTAVMPR